VVVADKAAVEAATPLDEAVAVVSKTKAAAAVVVRANNKVASNRNRPISKPC